MRKLGLLAVALLGGCAAVAEPAGKPAPSLCDDRALGSFVGRPASAELGAEMLARSGARLLRWVVYGSMITMEYSSERLTVSLDERNRVEAARCG